MSLASGVGAISGLDFNSIISQLRQINSQPIYTIQSKQAKLQTRQSSLNAVQKAVENFQSAAKQLTQQSNFLSLTASTTDRNVLAATVGSGASQGTYSVYVRQLAQAGRIAAQGVASADKTPIATVDGKFTYRVGSGDEISIDVTAGMTLQDLADAINNLDKPGVRASIINDGTPTNPYRLVLTSLETGAESKVSILHNDTILNLTGTTIEAAAADKDNRFDGTVTSSGTYTGTQTRNIVVEVTSGGAIGAARYRVSLDGGLTWSANDFATSATATAIEGADGVEIAFGAGTTDFAVGDRFSIDAFNPVLQEARDAVIEVDGIQLRRSTNTFSDVIQGVTLTPGKVSDEPQTVRITASTGGIAGKINDFVTAYNQLVNTVKQQTAYNVENKTAAPLFGDSGVTTLLAGLRQTVTSLVPGLESFDSLSSIGVRVNKDGLLEVDSAKLNKALEEKPEAVAALFAESGRSGSSAVQFMGSSTSTPTGRYQVQVTQVGTQATVTGSRALTGPLAAGEQLTIVYGDSQTAIVQLSAGSTLDQIVSTINAALQEKGLPVVATNEDGHLRINTQDYGKTERLRVTSNLDDVEGQLGFGRTTIDVTGADVQAVINGVHVSGTGRDLVGPAGSAIAGLRLQVTATQPLTTTITLTRGIAIQLEQQMGDLLDGKSGLFATRRESIDKQIRAFDDRITQLTERLNREEESLKKRFVSLESKLSSLQSEGNFLLSQLASLIG